MAIQEDFIKKLEFLTMYPGEDGYQVFIAIAKTEQGHRILCYAPRTTIPELECGQEYPDYDDVCDARHRPIRTLHRCNTLKLNGQIYMFHDDKHNGGDWFIKTIYLDGPRNDVSIDRKEIEKLFGCKVNG